MEALEKFHNRTVVFSPCTTIGYEYLFCASLECFVSSISPKQLQTEFLSFLSVFFFSLWAFPFHYFIFFVAAIIINIIGLLCLRLSLAGVYGICGLFFCYRNSIILANVFVTFFPPFLYYINFPSIISHFFSLRSLLFLLLFIFCFLWYWAIWIIG